MQGGAKRKHGSGPTKSALTTPLSIRVPNATLVEIAAAATPGDRVRGVGEVPFFMSVRRRARLLAALSPVPAQLAHAFPAIRILMFGGTQRARARA